MYTVMYINVHIIYINVNINVYFPCIGDVDYSSEIDIICGYVTSIIEFFKLPNMNVIISGDFNDDLSLSDSKGLNCLNITL